MTSGCSLNSKDHSGDQNRFDSVKEIQVESQKAWAIPELDYDNSCEDWKKRWRRCTISEGNYFEDIEKDKIKLVLIFDHYIYITVNFLNLFLLHSVDYAIYV